MAALLATGGAASGQAPQAGPVLVPVTVADPLNRFVTGLPQGAFEVYEDKVKQNIVSFSRDERPVSIGIVFDTSASMAGTTERAGLAVNSLLKTVAPEDEAFLVETGDRPQLTVPLTRTFADIPAQIASVEPKGRTALRDGVYLALATLRKAANPRKALIVISDGYDNNSRYTGAEIAGILKEENVQLYAIAIDMPDAARGRTADDLIGAETLRNLAEPTGGRHFVVESLAELPDVAAKIGIELRSQYVVGYSPGNQVRDGKYRTIQVRLVPQRGMPAMHAFWRTGYFAPTQ